MSSAREYLAEKWDDYKLLCEKHGVSPRAFQEDWQDHYKELSDPIAYNMKKERQSLLYNIQRGVPTLTVEQLRRLDEFIMEIKNER